MATRPVRSGPPKSSSKSRRRRAEKSTSDAYGVPVPESLHEAIETERGNLAKAESLLGCLIIAMEYGDSESHEPYYPDVAEAALELVRRSINGLDSVTLQRRLESDRVKEESEVVCCEADVIDSAVWQRRPALPSLPAAC
jgi:hypothetical protein